MGGGGNLIQRVLALVGRKFQVNFNLSFAGRRIDERQISKIFAKLNVMYSCNVLTCFPFSFLSKMSKRSVEVK
jgi:hypothetical protein